MGRGGGSCNSKSDDAVADDDSRPVRITAAAADATKATTSHPTNTTAPPTSTSTSSMTSAAPTPPLVHVDPTSPTLLSPISGPLPHTSSSSTPSAPSTPSSLSLYLSKVPLLSKLSPSDRSQLAAALTPHTFPPSTTVVREGDEGSTFYLIHSGLARVTKAQPDGSEVELATLHPSDFFGEQSLVNNSLRMATVTAVTELTCLCMTREGFASLFGSDRLGISFVKRTAVSAEAYGEGKKGEGGAGGEGGDSDRLGTSTHQAQAVKDERQRSMLLSAVSQSLLFASLTEEQRGIVVDRMWLQQVPARSTIIKQGDPGDHFYVVERGVFDIFVKPKPNSSPTHALPSPTTSSISPLTSPQHQKVAERHPSESFGELALLYNAPRAATVIAREDSAVWVLSRFTFRRIVTRGMEKKWKEYEAFLTRVTSFEALLDYERAKIAEALEEVEYGAGAVIVKQGDEGDTFFIIKAGQVRCTIRGEQESVEVARYSAGDFFGERALVNNERRAATVTAVTDTTCLYLNREAFALLLGPFEDIFRRRVRGYSTPTRTPTAKPAKPDGSLPPLAVSAAVPVKVVAAPASTAAVVPTLPLATVTAPAPVHVAAAPPLAAPAPKFSLSEFKIIGTLGKGSFGHVQLVRHYLTNTTYALKTVNKAAVVRLGQQEHMVNERRAMMALQHPFLVRLFATFQDKNFIYLLLEVSLGGELFTVLRSRTLFDEATARFYAAGVVVAFQFMHERGFIYRDLKPENLLLDAKGYLKITDFGFAKAVGDGRTWTLCGTPGTPPPHPTAPPTLCPLPRLCLMC